MPRKPPVKGKGPRPTGRRVAAKEPPRQPAEQRQERSQRAREILKILRREYPSASTELLHQNPFQLLIATILSAQCTDERVNVVTPGLFRRFPGPKDLAGANVAELESIIHSTGFYRMKAKNIIACSAALMQRHGGTVPSDMEALLQLPGVGRKTANVVLGQAFGIISGVVVDTHVQRLSQRMGFTSNDDPVSIERDLMEVFHRKDWVDVGSILVLHGRRVCGARRPKCPGCSVAPLCPSKVLTP